MAQKVLEQRGAALGERIDHRNAAPSKAVLQILAEQQAAAVLGGHGQDEGIPDLQAVVGSEVERALKGGPSGVDDGKAVGPGQQRRPGLLCGDSRFAGQDPI